MYTLGIETSCDETAIAVLNKYKVLSNVIISSLSQHKKYGGVIPEIATRAHVKNIDKVFNHALKEAKVSLKKINLVAFTASPGLIGALVVGTNFAKALSLSINKPCIGVNHLHAHLFAAFLNSKEKLEFPFLGVVVSGGHTQLYRVESFFKMKLLGSTRDDACGEVYDKVARNLKLGYPGGPVIDKLFSLKDKDAFSFKCGRIGFDLSFSGIKTAVIYKAKELEKKGVLDKKTKIKIVSAFQESVVNTLVSVVDDAVKEFRLLTVVCGGGVVANSYLRKRLEKQAQGKYRLLIAPREYSGDNAAIVAGLGFHLYNSRGKRG